MRYIVWLILQMGVVMMTAVVDEKTAVWQLIRERLQAKKSQIAAEILAYPPPIPACDAQFNFLLEERARVTRLLRELDKGPDEAVMEEIWECGK
jgi:hypothetical protein